MKDLVRVLRRIAITVAGTVIRVVGVVLLVAPGPGLLVILLALIVFAAEYEWARRYVRTVSARARSASERAAASRVATASSVLFGIGAIGLGGVLIFTDVLPLSGAGTGVSVALGGLTVLATTAYSVRELRRARASRVGSAAGDRDELGTTRCHRRPPIRWASRPGDVGAGDSPQRLRSRRADGEPRVAGVAAWAG